MKRMPIFLTLALMLSFSAISGLTGCSKVEEYLSEARNTVDEFNAEHTVTPPREIEEAEHQICLIPQELQAEFSVRMLSPDECINEKGEIVIDSTVTLGANDLIRTKSLLQKELVGEKQSDGSTNYAIDVLYYNKYNIRFDFSTFADPATNEEVLSCIGADSAMGLYRGMVWEASQLTQRYPDSLYEISKALLQTDQSTALDKTQYDVAYSFMPSMESGCDITFYVIDGQIKYTELYFGQTGSRWSAAIPVRSDTPSANGFAVETAGKFSDTLLLPSSYDLNNDGEQNDVWEYTLNYKVPRIVKGVPSADLLNLALETEACLDDIKQVKNGVFPKRLDGYATASYTYKLYRYNGLCALVTNRAYSLQGGGSGNNVEVYYFEEDTGLQINAEEYATRAGIDTQRIVRRNNSDENNYWIESFYDADFYADENGALQIAAESGA